MTCSDDSTPKQKLFYVIVLFILLLITSVVSAQTNPLKNVEAEEEIFQIVYKPQSPRGGIPAFLRYIQRNLKYPKQARSMGIEGTVIIRFMVAKNGEITQCQVLKSLHPSCHEAVIRVLKKSPKWRPGSARGPIHNLFKRVAVTFKLD
ncbi:MAG TPA: hypothetical protein DCS93_23010 [Microscillaceae bacterium]|nr:hypothetical protein [Microscillaceae bacterium]